MSKMSNMSQMQGQAALVTGGSSGIGLATAKAFARRGADVMIASRTASSGEVALAELRAAGGKAEWVHADVAKADDVRAMISATVDAFGRLDFAFNNGGTGGKSGPVDQIDDAQWGQSIDSYLNGTFLCMKYQLRQMLSQGAGVIVNNASVDGLRGFAMDPAYAAAKHGVVGLTRSAALQYADKNIRINAVCPSWIRTPRIEQRIAEDPQIRQAMLAHQPIGRLGEPEEVAELVVWLCDEGASLITGTAIPVDGGYTAM